MRGFVACLLGLIRRPLHVQCRECLISFARPLHPVTFTDLAFICFFVLLCKQVNNTLTSLDVAAKWDARDEEKIGPEGAKAFADALKVYARVTHCCDAFSCAHISTFSCVLTPGNHPSNHSPAPSLRPLAPPRRSTQR